MDEEEIKALVDKFDRRLQLVFLAAVREMKAAPIIRLLETGQIVEALSYVRSRLGTDRHCRRPLATGSRSQDR